MLNALHLLSTPAALQLGQAARSGFVVFGIPALGPLSHSWQPDSRLMQGETADPQSALVWRLCAVGVGTLPRRAAAQNAIMRDTEESPRRPTLETLCHTLLVAEAMSLWLPLWSMEE